MWPEFTNHIPLLTSSEKSWTVRSALTIWRHPRNHCIHSCHSPLQSSVLDSGISFWQGSSLSQQVIQQRFGDVTVACCDMAGISAQLDRSWHLHTAFLLLSFCSWSLGCLAASHVANACRHCRYVEPLVAVLIVANGVMTLEGRSLSRSRSEMMRLKTLRTFRV